MYTLIDECIIQRMKVKTLFFTILIGAIMIGCTQKVNDKNYNKQYYKNGKFTNPEANMNSNFSSFLSNVWKFLTVKVENQTPIENQIPVRLLTKDDILNMPNNSVTRLAHSTLLIKTDNKLILTDPVLSEQITPFPFFAPKSFHKYPISAEDLPFIDMVIISHNHYDHLDVPTLLKLKEKVGNFYTTLGVKKQLLDLGIDTIKIHELDWNQSITNNSIKLTATPAQHFSGRGLFDKNETLWASWVIKSSNVNLYFSGDTGYFSGFKEIGKNYGPFDMTFLEAGAYNENWKEIHMMPEQTVQAHLDLKGKLLFAIHNSTFKLSMHPWYEPLQKVTNEATKKGIETVHPIMGEIISLKSFTKTSKWWED